MKLDRVVLSTNNNSEYYSNLPLVFAAYRKFFPEVKISLAVIREKNDITLVQKLQHFCDDIEVYDLVDGVCSQNLAKLGRFFLASKFTEKVCMINDIDLIPLQREYYYSKLKHRKENELLCVGHNVYYKTPHAGKFPISYITAEGRIFKQLLNPMNYDWKAFISSFKNFKLVDNKEAVNKPFKQFSDESLIRALLSFFKGIKTCKQDCNFVAHKDSVTRKMEINKEKLMKGEYVESHHVLPLQKYENKIKLICQYLGIDFRMDLLK